MGVKCVLFLAIHLWVNLHSTHSKEVLAKCSIHNTRCHIDNRENPVEINAGDSIKMTINDTDTIRIFSIDQVVETPDMIRSIPLGIFNNFPRLKQLLITRTGNTTLRRELFEGGEQLEYLYLEKGIIRTIPSRVFTSLSKVHTVSLEHNKVETIEDHAFEGMEKLSELFLRFNNIRIIPCFAFTGAPNIELLHLTYNQIETIEEGAFNLPILREIYINNNKLVTLSDTLFNGASKLEKLFLDGNPNIDVNLLSIATLENLIFLDLEKTKFKFPLEKPVRKTTKSKLKKINLSFNNISDPDIFTHLSMFGQLEILNLNNNNFSVFNDSSQIKNYFPYLNQISIYSNGVSLCKWIEDNGRFLTNIRVFSTFNFNLCESEKSKDYDY